MDWTFALPRTWVSGKANKTGGKVRTRKGGTYWEAGMDVASGRTVIAVSK